MKLDEPDAKSLADDPDFLSSLSELDRGLDVPGDHVHESARSHSLVAAPHPAAEEPEIATEDLDDLDLAVDLPTSDRREASGGRRPLLDLFPPPPARDAAPPAVEIAPPPRLVRSRPVRAPVADGEIPTPTYETFYGFDEHPFSDAFDLKFLYHSAGHDEAAHLMLAAFRRHEGIVVLTGEAGVGKTTLCRAVSEELGRRTMIAFVSDPVSSTEDLLRTALVEFGVVARDDLARGPLMVATRQQLAGALRNFAASLSVLDASAIVFVENAQDLPAGLLDGIGDLLPSGDGQLQVVLVGEPELLRRLERDELARLKDLVAARVSLRRLANDEIAGYVMHRIMVAGNGVRVEFDDSAYAALAALSGGVPRLVNLLCGEALTLGQRAAATVIDGALVRAGAGRPNVATPSSPRTAWPRIASAAMVCAILMLAGAVAAAWVFRDRVVRTLVVWTSIPQPPAPPPLVLWPPLEPIPEPAGAEPAATAPAARQPAESR